MSRGESGLNEEAVAKQIRDGSIAGGKEYAFNDEHDPNLPADYWFQESNEGTILFIVFYTQACRWSRCLGCNLPSQVSSRHIGYRSLIAQIDWLFERPDVRPRLETIDKIIVSNNGSVLDEATFSSTALIYLIARVNLNIPRLKVFSLETRPEYVDIPELEFIARALAEGDTATELELAVGFEAFDERIRNDVFQKGLPLETFERFAEKISPYRYRVKCYFMQKPIPELSDSDAVDDIRAAVTYLDLIAERYNLPVNIHLNPTYAARGTGLEKAFREGAFTPPKLRDVARAALAGQGKLVTIFIGLSDEGLAVEGGGFIRPGDEEIVAALEEFNRSQDYEIIERIMRE